MSDDGSGSSTLGMHTVGRMDTARFNGRVTGDMNQRSHIGSEYDSRSDSRVDRRGFLGTAAAAATLGFTLPVPCRAAVRVLSSAVRIGVIADLHHDVMHDGIDRLDVFLKAMKRQRPQAIVQLGDFACPQPKNREIIDRFNRGHERTLHVIGNHDTDAGSTTRQCIDMWGMPDRHYVENINGVGLLVLDGNDEGSPVHQGGYPRYIGPKQAAWLKTQLKMADGPIIVACHQPLAGPWAIDNADEIQAILETAADKVILVINGHSHIDHVVRVGQVTHLHINSASYQWVGGDHRHQSYSKEIHQAHPWISCTCPYRDALFATLSIDPENHRIEVEGTSSHWVGKSPAELGLDKNSELIHGEHIAPRIRDRRIIRVRD